tara:strand:- start:122 stop:427 length:306 start_codon:yes stop_codon:yes gene_type:complete
MEKNNMFSQDLATTVGVVGVMTSDQGGLSTDQITEMAVKKIVSVSDSAPDPIRQQAYAFEDHVKKVLHYYIELAKKEERATVCQDIKKAGHNDLAEAIRRL